MTKQGLLLAVATGLLAGCSTTPELYCDEMQACTAGHPVCDLDGVCPMSDGIKNTCIPEACWDAGPLPDLDASVIDASVIDAPDSVADARPVDAMDSPDADTRTWQPGVLLANVNSAATESFPDISPDGLSLYLTRPGENTDIFVASRASTANDFGTPVAVAPVNSAGQEWAPHIASDNLELIFFRLGVGLMASKRTGVGNAWGTPNPLGIGGQWADSPATTGDGLTLYFIDSQTYVLYRSVRATKASAWGTPTEVTYPGVARYRHVDISADGLGLLLSYPGMLQNTDVIVSWKASLADEWTSLGVIPSLLDETLVPRYAAFNEAADEIYFVQDKSPTNFMDTEIWVTRKQ